MQSFGIQRGLRDFQRRSDSGTAGKKLFFQNQFLNRSLSRIQRSGNQIFSSVQWTQLKYFPVIVTAECLDKGVFARYDLRRSTEIFRRKRT